MAYHLDSLERETRALVQEEVDNETTHKITGGEDKTVAELDGLGDERREEREQEVPQPVASSRESGLFGASTHGERLSDDNPGAGSPGGSEPKNEHA